MVTNRDLVPFGIWETHGFPRPSSTGNQQVSRPLPLPRALRSFHSLCAPARSRPCAVETPKGFFREFPYSRTRLLGLGLLNNLSAEIGMIFISRIDSRMSRIDDNLKSCRVSSHENIAICIHVVNILGIRRKIPLIY